MLSYRHSFHAGNYADVLKHIVVIEILEHFIKKDKAFDYIDTHAGAGLYNLKSETAQKLNEHDGGIAAIASLDLPEIQSYLDQVRSFNLGPNFKYYPGSPSLAARYLRGADKAWLYELHPQDYRTLSDNFKRNKNIRVFNDDGLQGLLAKFPPLSRRGFALIDPSYEVKAEYDLVLDTLERCYQKFTSGTYAIWYPVVERRRIDSMERKLRSCNIKNIQRFELAVSADAEGHGMTSSGMFVVNPPWTLMEKMKLVLPKLLECVGTETGFVKAEILVAE